MFDILGIDWGQKRFGLAFANSSTQLILVADYPCPAVDIWNILEKEIKTRKVKHIVVGRPVNFRGGETVVTNLVDDFVAQLEAKYPYLKVETIDERGSSKNSKDQADKQQINHLAAGKILECYFGVEKS